MGDADAVSPSGARGAVCRGDGAPPSSVPAPAGTLRLARETLRLARDPSVP
ncbi:hypothetical protein Sliba_48770 [Streptomyces nigrescens]|uniref:Uncharacterized protein n=1 Tax=Streptomyces nigrescens TaxID=1920 RepID=A0A640TMF7_STRNI|nr:hypothetical protein Sliba_48770 [Streptomyces libani subsp. libani]GGV94304.1 hypothetical protein GCM10010500_31710 [Streptomyces libani subsp. libani]